MPDAAYWLTVYEHEIDKIRQQLFFYDNPPPDKEIVKMIKEWRRLNERLRQLGAGIVT